MYFLVNIPSHIKVGNKLNTVRQMKFARVFLEIVSVYEKVSQLISYKNGSFPI